MRDIIAVVRADYRRIRHMQEALHDAGRYCSDPCSRRVLASVWNRLAFLIEMNADAEEEICHLPMFGTSPQALDQIQDAVADLGEIRAAIDEARLQPAGSVIWWRAVRAALSASARHCDRQEGGVLAEFRRRAARSRREKLADQWLAFTSARIAELVPPARQGGAVCEFCEWPLANRHRHVLDAQRRGIFCSCDVCHDLSRRIAISSGSRPPGRNARHRGSVPWAPGPGADAAGEGPGARVSVVGRAAGRDGQRTRRRPVPTRLRRPTA